MRKLFRKANESDGLIIKGMFYYSIYIPEGAEPISRDLIESPELNKYYRNWKRDGDIGYIADVENESIAAIWLRLFDEFNKGYGFVDSRIPELAMAVMPEFRNLGIGSELLKKLLSDDELIRFKAISLSVHKGNRAFNLYLRHDFEIVGESDETYTMVKKL